MSTLTASSQSLPTTEALKKAPRDDLQDRSVDSLVDERKTPLSICVVSTHVAHVQSISLTILSFTNASWYLRLDLFSVALTLTVRKSTLVPKPTLLFAEACGQKDTREPVSRNHFVTLNKTSS